MQIEFSQVVQGETDRLGLEMTAQQIHDLLEREYLQASEPYTLIRHRLQEENGTRSEERRVGKECSSRGPPWQQKDGIDLTIAVGMRARVSPRKGGCGGAPVGIGDL